MKTTVVATVVAVVLIGGAVVLANRGTAPVGTAQGVNNVSLVAGKQVITINAKGGYSPQATTAQAEVPTILKIDTQGTFDCSSALTIPSLGIRQNLPPSGETEVAIGPQKAGTTLHAVCAMGMYNFSVTFL